jgi:hypothetical protein
MERSSITNSYALGDVFAGNPTSANAAVYAGGLVGYTQIVSGGTNPDAGKVAYNFAAGSVTAQSASSSAVYAGGIAGYMVSGELSGYAAFGGAVTVKGSGTKTAARVYAYSAGGGANNYALKTTRLYTAASYTVPGDAATPPTASSMDGANAIGDDFRTRVLWETDLGFSALEWDFFSVWSRGYPTLKNAGGQ